MAKETGGFWDGILKIGAAIGGGWLAVEIYKALSKEVYYCPNCHNKFDQKYSPQCPHCKINLRWEI